MMATWAASDPLRHPWFASASLKRKHSDSSDEDLAIREQRDREADSDQESTPVFYPTPPPESAGLDTGVYPVPMVEERGDEYAERKRRRCDTIERKMARMYINGERIDTSGLAYDLTKSYSHQQNTQNQNQNMVQGVSAPGMSAAQSATSDASYAYTAGSLSPIAQNAILSQYAVEEPVSPEFQRDAQLGHTNTPTIAEVRMKGAEPAWYEREKDRIVITDLDEAAEEAEEEYKSEAEPHPNAAEYAESNADYSISSVLLDHIKRQANFPYVPPAQNREKDGALILFRPPPASFFAPPASATATEEERDNDVQVEEISESAARAFSPTGEFTMGTVSMDQAEDGMEAGEPMDMDMDIEL